MSAPREHGHRVIADGTERVAAQHVAECTSAAARRTIPPCQPPERTLVVNEVLEANAFGTGGDDQRKRAPGERGRSLTPARLFRSGAVDWTMPTRTGCPTVASVRAVPPPTRFQ